MEGHGVIKSAVVNKGEGGRKLSFKQVVAKGSPSISAAAMFNSVLLKHNVEPEQCGGGERPATNGGGLPDRDGSAASGSGGEKGKLAPLCPKILSLSPNKDMVSVILNERSRLKSIAIFFCLPG